MEMISDGLREAAQLLMGSDRSIWDAAFRSLWISVLAVGVATTVGIPVGTLLARKRFPASRFLVLLFRVCMSLPTVFVGVLCFSFFSREGFLGPLELLYTPWAIVFGELILAFPIVVSLTYGAISSLDVRVGETAWLLGANWFQRVKLYVSEARGGVMLAVLTAFSRCVTELGIAMMVGGNIKDRTRTLSTATALETGKGEFGRGLAMGLLLLVIAMSVTLLMSYVGRSEGDDEEGTR
ncbi:MAG: ABC transporter permease [Planctomycetaceae bacterium]